MRQAAVKAMHGTWREPQQPSMLQDAKLQSDRQQCGNGFNAADGANGST
jgi:hypothetical protein